MAKLTYAQQLLHPLWQRRRLEMLAAASWKCTVCCDTEKTLHVHHRQYFKGRMAWEYSNAELQVLCADCHEKEHASNENLKRLLNLLSTDSPSLDDGIALLAGFYSPHAQGIETFLVEARLDARLASIGFVADAMKRLSTDQLCVVLDLVERLAEDKPS